jgi:hypothetical protein
LSYTIDWAQARQLITDHGPAIAYAIIVLVAAHFAARAVKWAIGKGVERIPFLKRQDQPLADGEKPAAYIGDRIGEVAYWLVWLVGLIAALNLLGLVSVVEPLNNIVNGLVRYVPQAVGAVLTFAIGFALATIARWVEAAAEAANIDKRLADAGLSHTPRGSGVPRLLGVLVFTLIIIPVSIQALDFLNITAISDPATAMLGDILSAIPRVLGAALIIFIAYLVGRWVAMLTEEGLESVGFDAMIRAISQAEPSRRGAEQTGLRTEDSPARFPPSRMIGLAVLVGIVLFASVEAARLLEFGAVAGMLGEVLALASRVLFGAVIIGFGVLLANIFATAVIRSDTHSGEVLSVFVRWGVIALAAALGLRFMGLANEIITLAFGLTLGAVAVAAAIAFGIGGRDAAKRLLERWTGR